MGQCYGTCIKRGKKSKDTRSSYRIIQYVMEGLSEFVLGLFALTFFLILLTIYLDVPADPTLSVTGTNLKNAIILASFGSAGFAVFAGMGGFGNIVNNVFNNPWLTLHSFVISLLDARIRTRDWWLVILPLIYMGSSIAGAFGGSATFFALFPSMVIPTVWHPVLANVVQSSYGWAILIGSLVYTAIFHVFAFSCNGTRFRFANLWPLFFVMSIGSIVMFSTTRLLPNFTLNIGYMYLTGHYELLWVDVVNAFIGLVLTWLLYFFLWSPRAEPDQVLQYPNLGIPWDFSVQNSQDSGVKMSKKTRNVQNRPMSNESAKTE